jgi:tRNA dimethylallyltransferase
VFSAILIAGPTASGKSALAIRLAQLTGGTVINADSMQVYRDLRILSARPSVEEVEQAPHLLFGHVDGAVNYSVGRWIEDAAAAMAGVHLPIFVGGTGMYFKAMTQGLSQIPAVPDDVRQRVRAEAEGVPPEALHAQLATVDPVMAARLRPSDPQRLLRALEIYAATGRSLSEFQGSRAGALLNADKCLCLFLAPERAVLNARIDARFDVMMQQGALDEVAALAARALDPALPVMRAHGVPHLIAHLRGALSLDEAAELSKRDTRHYAKRQFTFVRHQLPDFAMVMPEEAEGFAHAALLAQQPS